jgi:hypothetical protein
VTARDKPECTGPWLLFNLGIGQYSNPADSSSNPGLIRSRLTVKELYHRLFRSLNLFDRRIRDAPTQS